MYYNVDMNSFYRCALIDDRNLEGCYPECIVDVVNLKSVQALQKLIQICGFKVNIHPIGNFEQLEFEFVKQFKKRELHLFTTSVL